MAEQTLFAESSLFKEFVKTSVVLDILGRLRRCREIG